MKISSVLGTLTLLALASYFLIRSHFPQREFQTELASTAPENVVGTCNCKLNFVDEGVIAYEDPSICTEDRKYLSPVIEKLTEDFPWITEVRDPFPEAKVPRECAVLSMKYYNSKWQSQAYEGFGICATRKKIRSDGTPQRMAKVPCVTKEYANAVYNAFIDVTDCFNLNQKDLFLQITKESQFHINAYGVNGDAGLGQLTGPAIQTVFGPYYEEEVRTTRREFYLREAGRSGKESCQRIIEHPPSYEIIDSSNQNRCNLMMPPENPYRNMVYTAIFYRSMMHDMAGILYINGKDYIKTPDGLKELKPGMDFDPGGFMAKNNIRENLIRLGILNPNMHAVTQALLALGYNTGPGTAVIMLDAYLRKRLEAKRPLAGNDLNFLLTDFLKARVPKLGNRTLLDLALAQRRDQKAKAQLDALRKVSHTKPLVEHFFLHQTSGTPGYLSSIAEKYKQLIEIKGDKSCVSDTFFNF